MSAIDTAKIIWSYTSPAGRNHYEDSARHKKPISKRGRTEPNNLWTLCRDCNRGKGAKYYVSE